MKPIVVSSRQNPIVKRLQKILSGKGPSDEVVIEGWKLVDEAVKAGRAVKVVMIEKTALVKLQGMTWWNALASAEVYEGTDAVLEVVSDTVTPQGIVAIIDKPSATLEMCLQSQPERLLWLDGVQDPGNVGTLIRTAVAFGVVDILIGVGTASPWNPKTLRASMGAVFRARVAEVPKAQEWVAQAHRAGYRLAMAHPRGGVRPDRMKGHHLIIGIGGESKGFDPATLALGETVTIPMSAEGMESLNASIAGALLIYELTKN